MDNKNDNKNQKIVDNMKLWVIISYVIDVPR